jgi:hypothetical protein
MCACACCGGLELPGLTDPSAREMRGAIAWLLPSCGADSEGRLRRALMSSDARPDSPRSSLTHSTPSRHCLIAAPRSLSRCSTATTVAANLIGSSAAMKARVTASPFWTPRRSRHQSRARQVRSASHNAPEGLRAYLTRRAPAAPPTRKIVRTDEDTIALVRRLAAHYLDVVIAGILSRQGRKTACGHRSKVSIR